MDALSDVLGALRFSGAVFLDGEFTAPWCVPSRVTLEDFPNRSELPPSVVGFHYVLDGEMQVQIDGTAPLVVRAGEMVLLPRNDPHLLASESGIAPADPVPPVERHEGGLMRMVYGGGGAATRLVCGYIASEVRSHPLLEALPIAFALDVKGKPCADWVAASFRFAAHEVASGRAASETVLAKLSELLFVEAVHRGRIPDRERRHPGPGPRLR